MAERLRGRGRRWLVVAALAAALLVGTEGLLRQAASWLLGADGARWIWAEPAPGQAEVVTFYALRDFWLHAVPAEARLRVAADEEVHLFLNGTLVVSRRHRAGDPPVAVPVAPLLRPGVNRLAAELRSARGFGGFLLRLDAGGRTLVASGPGWIVSRRFEPGLLQAGHRPLRAETPRVWGRPPTGRWRLGRPELATLAAEGLLDAAPRLPRRVRIGPDGPWHRLESDTDWRSLPLGRQVTFDWGESIVACVNLVFDRTETGRGFFWAGERPIRRPHWPASGYFRKAPGIRSWSDTETRSFRYLTVWSDTELVGARAFRFDPGAGLRPAVAMPASGVLGMRRRATPQPALERMWQQMERAEARADGERPTAHPASG